MLSYTSSPGYHILADKKDNYAAAIFDEGHYLQVEVAAKLKSSKQPELAQQFMQFMLTPLSKKPSQPLIGCILLLICHYLRSTPLCLNRKSHYNLMLMW